MPVMQGCRDCGKPFPHDPDADRCPACVAAALGATGEEASDGDLD